MTTRRLFLSAAAGAISGAMGADAEEIHWQSAEQIAAGLRRKKLSPVDLTRACLARIERLNPKLNAFITVAADQALRDASEAEREIRAGRWRGPLHGVPVALKDLFDTAGMRTTAASAQYAQRVPNEDAEVVRRLKAAGAVLLGKLNMDEFAYNFTSETSHFGASHNPWSLAHSPGGSSGGSAIAVAAGLCYAALGSDTGGSIRLPASFCGVTGFKPTYGRVSTKGVLPLAWSLDHVGPLCRTARDASLIMSALADRSAADPSKDRPVKTLRIGVPAGPLFEQLDPQVDSGVKAAIEELRRLCAGRVDIRLPAMPPSERIPLFSNAYATVITAEAYAFHKGMLEQHPDLYDPRTRTSIQNGAAVPAASYILARREMDEARAGASAIFATCDVIVSPTSPRPPLKLGDAPDLLYLRNTTVWNTLGLPTISIPCGMTKEGLPIGLQLTGPAGKEDRVLAVADAYQKVTSWHASHPRL